MVRAIPFGKLQKIWAEIWGDAIFVLFYIILADVDISYSDTHSRNFAILKLFYVYAWNFQPDGFYKW